MRRGMGADYFMQIDPSYINMAGRLGPKRPSLALQPPKKSVVLAVPRRVDVNVRSIFRPRKLRTMRAGATVTTPASYINAEPIRTRAGRSSAPTARKCANLLGRGFGGRAG